MKADRGERVLRERIREGRIRKQDVIRLLAELAFGKANGCVALVLEEKPELKRLDLRLLSEVRRNEKGTVEIKLLDRLRILEQLARMTEDEGSNVGEFLRAMQAGEEQ